MSNEKIRDLTEEELAEMMMHIGAMLVQVPRLALHLGHNRPLNTFRDYVRVTEDQSKPERMAIEFLHDLFAKSWGMPTEELLNKWYRRPGDTLFDDAPGAPMIKPRSP